MESNHHFPFVRRDSWPLEDGAEVESESPGIRTLIDGVGSRHVARYTNDSNSSVVSQSSLLPIQTSHAGKTATKFTRSNEHEDRLSRRRSRSVAVIAPCIDRGEMFGMVVEAVAALAIPRRKRWHDPHWTERMLPECWEIACEMLGESEDCWPQFHGLTAQAERVSTQRRKGASDFRVPVGTDRK